MTDIQRSTIRSILKTSGRNKPALTGLCSRILSVVLLSLPMVSSAHLMKAYHGTLKFLDDGVYMVLSLSASSFTDADEDNDHRLSAREISTHHADIVALIAKEVSLSSSDNRFPLHGTLLTPITPHHAPAEPAQRIVVLGKFPYTNRVSELQFGVGAFGDALQDRALTIRATRPAEDLVQIFELTSQKSSSKLQFN